MAGLLHPEMLLLLALLAPVAVVAFRHTERFSRIVTLSRSLIIVLIVLAASAPYITTQAEVSRQPEITVLRDDSSSSKLMDSTQLEFENVKINEKVIASGNSSDLRKGLLRNLESNTAYLMVSDLQSSSSLEGVAERFDERNSTLNALRTDMDSEASVRINGPTSTVPGARNRFTVKVHSTAETPEPEVRLDGEKVDLSRTGNSSWSFSRKFTEKGSHAIKASIDVNDRYGSNNQYFHAVEVQEKPRVLVVGDEGAIDEELEEFYRVDRRDNLPGDLSPYYTIILKKTVPEEQLIPYVSEGNGIVYTGDYKKEMSILPVKKVPGDTQTDAARIFLVIDISKGTGEGGAADRIKTTSYNLADKLPFNTNVGAVAYNDEAYTVSSVKPLSKTRGQLKDKISRLKPEGNSLHHRGLEGGKELANGTGNIIMITDGKISALGRNTDTAGKSRRIASSLTSRLITVGAGSDRNAGFLKDLGRRGNGFYLDAEDSSRLQFQFKAGGGSGKTTPLVVIQPDHFVTQDLQLVSSASAFDSVETRRGADQLVSGTNGQPFLSTWRYGLGKVAAFSGGNDDLSKITQTDPLLITRTVSWTVGDPKRKKDRWLEIDSARKGEKVEARSSYKIDGLKRQGKDLYAAELEPEKLGFHSFKGQSYSYNYEPEIEELGYSEKMTDTVRATGGKVYTLEEKDQIQEDLKKFSESKVKKKQPLTNPLILAALLVFLSEVGYRKMSGKK